MKEVVFEIGYDKNNDLDFSIRGNFYKQLTREQYNEILKMAFYCLKTLENFIVEDNDNYAIAKKE